MTLWGRTRLDDHIDLCTNRHDNLRRQLELMAEQARREHEEFRVEFANNIERTVNMHHENQARGERTQGLIIKFGFVIVTIILAAMASQHI